MENQSDVLDVETGRLCSLIEGIELRGLQGELREGIVLHVGAAKAKL